LPVLTGIGYEDMEISQGEMASLKFMESVFGDVSEEERNKIRADLLVYCGQDTGGMVEIIRKLTEIAGMSHQEFREQSMQRCER
jgi:hypothetical protein